MSVSHPVLGLLTAINENRSADEMITYATLISQNIKHAARDRNFSLLPLDSLEYIISHTKFNFEDDSFATLRCILKNADNTFKQNAISLLNSLKLENLPNMGYKLMITLLSNFKHVKFLSNFITLVSKELEQQEEQITSLKESLFKKEQQCSRLKKELTDTKEDLNKLSQDNKRLRSNLSQAIHKINEMNDQLMEKEGELQKLRGIPISFLRKQHTFDDNVIVMSPDSTIETLQACYLESLKNEPLLIKACINGDLITVKRLIEACGIDKNTIDKNGKSVLSYASENGHIHIVQYLFDIQKVSLESRDCNGWSPLHFACSKGHLPVVEFMLKNKADPFALTRNNEAIIDIAADNDQKHIVWFLCDHKYFRVSQKNNDRQYALDFDSD